MRAVRPVELLLVLLVIAASVGLAGAVSAQVGPTLTAPGQAVPGEEIRVRGEGWPASRLVMVETCGNAGRGGSTHCDQTRASSVSTSREGVLTGFVTVGLPPSPCPCVIHAFIVGGVSQRAAIEIPGAPIAEPTPEDDDPVATLSVDAHLEDISSWASWFGAAPERRLVLTIENVSDRTVSWAPLDLSWGRPTDPSRAIDAPVLEPLAAGESVRLTIPVVLDALAFGDYVVRGEIIGQPDVAFSVRTSAHPWGLLALPGLLVLQLVLVRARNGLARAVQRRLPDSDDDAAVDGAGDGWPVAPEPEWDLEVALRESEDADVLLDLSDSDPCSGREHEPA